MEKIFTAILISLIFLFAGCSYVYRDFKSVKDMKWYRTDIKTFDVNIPDDGNYDLMFALRHLTGYPFTSIKVKIEEKTPEGKLFEKKAEFFLADENGNYIGDVTGELWDIEVPFDENVFLKKGKYTFKISHDMNHNPVILVIDVGLTVKKH
ncbi:MAG: gliding motility lipoprotein GldH [Chlorobi bacterium]|nr:gliding motility lipoprotein GldH [Chlorobiota bacterium]